MDARQFPITKDPQRKNWRVNVPPQLSESGQRERKFFNKKTEAEGWVAAQVVRLKNDGTSGVELLSPALRDIAAKAFRLFPAGEEHLLLDAARAFIAQRDRRKRSKTFAEAYKEWEAFTLAKTRNGQPTSAKYKAQVRQGFARLHPLHEKIVCDITPEDIEATLAEVVAAEYKHARNQLLRTLTACLNYCIEREWLTVLPIKPKLMARDTGHREPSVLTPDQAARLLATVAEMAPEFLGAYVIALFAGVRPTDELAGLRWEHVFADGGETIHIPADIAKTHFQRYVKIEPTLAAWLKHIAPPNFGQVMPNANIRKENRKIRRAAGLHPWPQDVMRHTYASCWMAVYRDEDRCRDNMGHRTKDQLVRHYRKHMTESQAKAFWELTPDAVLKITNIKQA
jgi:integrase